MYWYGFDCYEDFLRNNKINDYLTNVCMCYKFKLLIYSVLQSSLRFYIFVSALLLVA